MRLLLVAALAAVGVTLAGPPAVQAQYPTQVGTYYQPYSVTTYYYIPGGSTYYNYAPSYGGTAARGVQPRNYGPGSSYSYNPAYVNYGGSYSPYRSDYGSFYSPYRTDYGGLYSPYFRASNGSR